MNLNINNLIFFQKHVEDVNLKAHTLLVKNDSILYVGGKNGLWKYDNEKLQYLGDKYKLLQNRIDDITEDNYGNLWLATKENGIIIKTKDSLFQITEEDGLSSNAITTLSIDNNIVWAGTMYGVNKITVHDINKGKYKIERIYKRHGLASNLITDIVANNGIVVRPASNSEDVQVLLTAILSKGNNSYTKQFSVIVKKI